MSRSFAVVLALAALSPGRASATALDALGPLPPDTGWAIAVTEPSVPLERLRGLFDLLHAAKKEIPDAEAIAAFLRQALGFNPLDDRDLADQGVDLARGIAFHGRIEGLMGPVFAIDVSIATTDPTRLRGMLARLAGLVGLREGATSRVAGADVVVWEGFTSLVMFASPGWVHVCVGSNGDVLLGEAKRILKAGKGLAGVPVMKAQAKGILGARGIGAWMDLAALARAAILHDAKRREETRKYVNPEEVARFDEEARREAEQYREVGRLGVALGGLEIARDHVDGRLFTSYDKPGRALYAKLFPRAKVPGFDVEAISRASALGLGVQVDAAAFIQWLIGKEPDVRIEWAWLDDFVRKTFALDLMKDVVGALQGHVAFIVHGVAPLTSAELAAAHGPPGELIFAHVQWALLLRADGRRLGPAITSLFDQAAKVGLHPERRETGATTWYSVSVESPQLQLHVGVGPDAVVLGGGPGLPDLASGWTAPAGRPSEAMAWVTVSSDAVYATLQGLLTPDAVAMLHLKQELLTFRRAEPVLKLLHLGTLVLRSVSSGFQLEGLLHHD